MKYIDVHCHLDFPDYGAELGEVLARMREREVGAITIGTDLESCKRAVKIAEENENIWACIGVHPEEKEFDEALFEKLVASEKVVAIGECGLDFFRLKPEELEAEKERQEILFRKQIEFALKHNKPLMLHCRPARNASLGSASVAGGDSYDEVRAILESYDDKKLRGNSHFFAGTKEQAKRFLDLGFTLSFTGVVTFTHDYDEVIKFAPIGSIMSETDSPFVAPVPYRGKRNEPTFVIEVAKKIAEIRGETEEKVRIELLQNAQKMFGLPS